MQVKKSFLLYGLLVAYAASAQQAPPPLPSEYESVKKLNYVRSWDVVKPTTVSDSLKTSTGLSTARMTSQYIDGLGRPVQTVVKQGSLVTDSLNLTSAANAKDLVNAIEYDQYGREVFQYLPFVSDTIGGGSTGNGLFKINPFQQQVVFYNSQLSGQSGETNLGTASLNWAFSKTEFEASALNRVSKSMAPGSSWVGSERGVVTRYWANTVTDSVRIWNVTDGTNAGDWGSYTTTLMYAAGQLQKTLSEDEHGKQVIEFKDKEGQVVLKKVQLTAVADTLGGSGRGHHGWICTYYIYDDRNRLRAVIQPEGVKTLATNSWDLGYNSGILLNEQCFRYEYDHRGRMIVKKVPGAGEVYMVYDARDRLVLTQDANMRTGTVKWLYTQYDELNRPLATGLWNSSSSRSTHASAAASSTSYPDLSSQTYEELSNTFYDSYAWLNSYTGHGLTSSLSTTDAGELLTPSNTTFPYPQAVQQSSMLRGIATGARIKVLGENIYRYSVSFYDEKGRLVQSKSKNYSGGTDVTTTQYSFAGQPLLSILRHEKGGTNAASHLIVTKMTMDELGRVVKTEKKIGGGSYRQLSVMEYDGLGQLNNKRLGTDPSNTSQPLETLTYEYNIRGWMLGMNRSELAANGGGSRRFGFELGYDKTASSTGRNFSAALYNGNITGMAWESVGDGVRRKYDFSYDAANRFMQGLFEQNDGGSSWGASVVDYKVKMGNGSNPDSAYDYNGNILRMQQWGLKLSSSAQIDDLRYGYIASTNRLKNVIDQYNDTATRMGDFRSSKAYMTSLSGSKTTGATDYSYDTNGNLTQDLNKDITSISYNYLNLPATITTALGTITYAYDAVGNKLKKTVNETGKPSRSTLYIAGAVYENDTLQFLAHEEGRIRRKDTSFHLDYFIKDHLGNVRMVLTEEQQTDAYPAATMEADYIADEAYFYSNISATQSNLPDGYPEDTYTDPNQKVARLRAADTKVGPGIVLKVMAGDKFNVRVSSWYSHYTASSVNDNMIAEDLLDVLTGGITRQNSKASSSEISGSTSLSSSMYEFFSLQDSGMNSALPKAFLNWMLLDEQFNLVESSSGFDQVGPEDEFTVHLFENLPLNNNGYLYVYVSNASEEDYVYFDNLQVTHIRGALLEETHYYPFGLTMYGISISAVENITNKHKFNEVEFNSDLQLLQYDAFYRNYNQQLGRFLQLDPKVGSYENLSPYTGFLNNPIRYADPLGDSAVVPEKSVIQTIIERKDVKEKESFLDYSFGLDKGIYAGSGKVFGVGVGVAYSRDQQTILGHKNGVTYTEGNEDGAGSPPTTRDGAEFSVGPVSASDKRVTKGYNKVATENQNVKDEVSLSVGGVTQTTTKDYQKNKITTSNSISIIDFKFGVYFGAHASLSVNVQSQSATPILIATQDNARKAPLIIKEIKR